MKVFLTGASAGIGLETARVLCRAGHEVWGSSRSLGRLPVLERFHPVELDLLKTEAIAAACDRVWQEAGEIDVLINNAGQAFFGPLEQMPSDSLRRQFELLFFAPLAIQQNLIARMRRGKGGLIVNVSSLAAELPIPFMGAYSAAKASFSVASAALRLEMTDKRIRCVDLRPGDISTDFNQSVARSEGSGGAAAARAWKTIERNMAGAPSATVVAERILAIVEGRDTRPVNRVGDWFQSVLAPLGPRFLSAGLLERWIRSYYGVR